MPLQSDFPIGGLLIQSSNRAIMDYPAPINDSNIYHWRSAFFKEMKSHFPQMPWLILNLDQPNYWQQELLEKHQISFESQISKSNQLVEVSNCIHQFCTSRQLDGVLVVPVEEILTLSEWALAVIKQATQYLSEYVYPDHILPGFSPTFVHRDLFEKFHLEKRSDTYNSQTIQEIIDKDPNSFDLEVVVGNPDWRWARTQFRWEGIESRLACQRLCDHLPTDLEKPPVYSDIIKQISKTPNILRTMPAYVELELTNECDWNCKYCPRQKMTRPLGQIAPEHFKILMTELDKWNPNIVVNIGGQGEPTLHNQFLELLLWALDNTQLEFIVETNGERWTPEFSDPFQKYSGDRLKILFSIDGVSAAIHESQRKTDTFGLVEKHLMWQHTFRPGGGYLQWLRTEGNESEIHEILPRWKDYQDQIVIIDAHSYGQRIQIEPFVDTSPLKRFPCFHLRRDMIIGWDGALWRCRQDMNADHTVGNVFESSVAIAWENLEETFVDEFNGKRDSLCEKCTDWYQPTY